MRNVRDWMQDLEGEDIRNYCLANSYPAAVAMMQIHGDFNFGSVVRNANFLGFREVHYVGKSKYDKRSAVGTYNYTNVIWHDDADALFDEPMDNYTPVALENNVDFKCVDMPDFEWPPNPIILVGEEQEGLSADVLGRCEAIVSIPTRGSVRSLNASTAAGIAMYSYMAYWHGKLMD